MKINKTKLYGVLTEPDGTAIRHKVRVLKVGIGLPKGPDVHVWIDANDKWSLGIGEYQNGKRVGQKIEKIGRTEGRTPESIHAKYLEARRTAPVRNFPMKLPYFTFTRMGVGGDYVHDLEAIESHGSLPTEVDVIFLMSDPLEAMFQWFTAAELKCEGDGLIARRRTSLALSPEGRALLERFQPATVDEQVRLAMAADGRGEKFYEWEICYTSGCPFANGDNPPCKAHGRLFFQLVNTPSIGGTCYFDTTGKRSINQLASCLDEVREATRHSFPPDGIVTGIPMKLVVRPYRTSHNGRPTVQYGVSLEVRGGSAIALWREMVEQASEFLQVRQGVYAKQLKAAPPDAEPLSPTEAEHERRRAEGGEVVDDDDVDPADAAALEAEYYPTANEQHLADDANETFEDPATPGEVPDESHQPEATASRVSTLRDITAELKKQVDKRDDMETKAANDAAEQSLFTNGSVKEFHGVEFPADVTAGSKDPLLLAQMDAEAQRAGVNLLPFVIEAFNVRPVDLGSPAAAAMVEVLKKLPDKDDGDQGDTIDARLAKCQYVNQVKKLAAELTSPDSKLTAAEKAEIEKKAIKRIEEIKEAKRTAAQNNVET